MTVSLQPLKPYEPDHESLQKEQEIQDLIAYDPTQQDIDRAADIAMTISSKTVCHFMLTDICRAYLSLSTFEGCRRAFWIAKKKEELGDVVHMLMNEVVAGCIKQESPPSLSLAQEIFDGERNVRLLSPHKHDLKVALMRQREKPYHQQKNL